MPRDTSSANITTEDILSEFLEDEKKCLLQPGEITARIYLDHLEENGIHRGVNYARRKLAEMEEQGIFTRRMVLVGNHWVSAYKKK